MKGRWRATHRGNDLDTAAHKPNQNLGVDFFELLSTNVSSLCRNFCSFGFLALSVLFIVDAYNSAKYFATFGLAQFVRFDAVMQLDLAESFNRSLQTLSASGELSLLRAGCIISHVNLTLVEGEHVTVKTGPIVEIDGFAISIFAQNYSLAGARILLQGSNDDGKTMTTVGQSADFRKVAHGLRFLESNLEQAVGSSVLYDFRPPWPMFVDTSMESVWLACGCLGVGLSTILKRTVAAVQTILLITVICALNAGIAGVGYLMQTLPRDSFYPLFRALLYLLASIALYRSNLKPFLFLLIIYLGLFSIIGRTIQDCIIYHDCSYLADAPPVLPMIFTVIGASFLLLRSFVLENVFMSIAEDQSAYDARWSDLLTVRSDLEALQRLQTAVELLNAKLLGQEVARQLNRPRTMAANRTKHQSWVPSPPPDAAVAAEGGRAAVQGKDAEVDTANGTAAGQVDATRPVRSLDQLYAQACVAAALQQCKAAQWAAATRGRHDSAEAPALAPGDPLLTPERLLPPEACRLVRQRALKPPARALDKARICYGGDLSLLLDIARARLLFESAADLLECVSLVCTGDVDVRVVRVKNSLHDKHESADTAGFRVY